MLVALRKADGRSTGKLHTEFGAGLDRDNFEQLLAAMARVGLLEIKEATFKADGRDIAYRKVTLTWEGSQPGSGDGIDLLLKEQSAKKSKSKVRGKTLSKPARKPAAAQANPKEKGAEAMALGRSQAARRPRLSHSFG